MKKLFFLTCIAILGLISAACSDVQYDSEAEDLMEIVPMASSATKAPIDGAVALPSDRKLKVSAYYNVGTTSPRGESGDYFSNVTFTYFTEPGRWRGGTEAAPAPRYWPLRGNLDIFAYSADGIAAAANDNPTPTYNVGSPVKVSNGATVTIGDNSSTQVDIVFGNMLNQTKIATGNPLTMRHAQALIVFTASSNVAYNASTNYGITIDQIVLENAYFGGTLKMDVTASAGSQCTWTALSNQKTQAAGGRALLNTSSSSNLAYQVPTTAMNITAAGNHFGIGGMGIMVPEQSATKFVIKYRVHNGKDDAGTAVTNSMEYEYACSGTWDEGKKYVYGIVFTLDQIEIVPSVVDWNNQAVAVPIPAA